MRNSSYFKQAELLLRILPIVNRESAFALKGGTAINFFVRDMPRLSVDIDLVYLPMNPRKEALQEISDSLLRIQENILRLLPDTRIYKKAAGLLTMGLIVSGLGATVKIEPNTTIRGTVYPTTKYRLCKKGEDLFELSVEVRSLVMEELYAGKICAALDRQHPRDIFDLKLLYENEGITESTRKAFIVYLISHNRPMSELLNPNFTDISTAFEQEFRAMVTEVIELVELLGIRERLFTEIGGILTDTERQFLLSFKSMNPDWDLLGLPGIEELPAVKWKLLNLKKMSRNKHLEAMRKLEKTLFKS